MSSLAWGPLSGYKPPSCPPGDGAAEQGERGEASGEGTNGAVGTSRVPSEDLWYLPELAAWLEGRMASAPPRGYDPEEWSAVMEYNLMWQHAARDGVHAIVCKSLVLCSHILQEALAGCVLMAERGSITSATLDILEDRINLYSGVMREHANFDIQTKVFPALVRRGIQVPQNYGPTFTELQRRLGRIHQLVTEATNCSGVEQHNKLKEAWARLVAYTNLLLIGLRAEVEDVSFLIRKHLSVAEAKKIFRASFEEALGETSFKGFVELLGMSFAGIHRLPARKCLTNFKAQHLSLPQRLFIVSFVIPRWRANFLRPLQKMSKEYSKDINGTTRDLAFFTAMGNVFRKKNAVGPESRTVRGAK